MATESTLGLSLLAEVARLGLPVLGDSRGGRPIHGGLVPGGAAATGRPLVVMGGIHGDEPASVGACLDLLDRLAQTDPGLTALSAPVVVVPALNPDGLVYGTKNSAADVDLNRNFPARNFVTEHKPGYCPGPAPLSEPETAAFAALLEAHPPLGVVAVHAPFACINHDGGAAAWAEAVALASGWPARADLGYPTPGSLGSWLGVDRGLPVLTIELPPGPLADFRTAGLAALVAAVTMFPGASGPGRAA